MHQRTLLLLPSNSTSTPHPQNNTTPSSTSFSPTSFEPSCLGITILVLLTFLVFVGLFSLYSRRVLHWQQSLLSSTTTKGLDASTIKALPVQPFSDAASSTPNECVVCLEEFEDGERVKVIPSCGHLFHPKCIDAWLLSRGSCPICRSTKMVQEEEKIKVEVVVHGSEDHVGER